VIGREFSTRKYDSEIERGRSVARKEINGKGKSVVE
jgi:hypothetical protein